jgi:predicted nucleic acid-binding protein
MIFADTSAWYAFFVVKDSRHQDAKSWILRNGERLVTTDYVLDELLTLMKCRGEYAQSLAAGESILFQEVSDLTLVSLEDIENAWNVFKNFRDKGWSFTDCTSYVVMKKFSLTKAFAFDEHFSQFGNVEVVP